MFNLHLILCGLTLLIVQVILGPPDLNIFNKFKQNDYKIKFERLEMMSFNKTIMKRFEIKTFKYNRTWAVSNLTFEFNINVGNKLEVVLQLYKFMSNEFRYFPVRFQVNCCYALSKNLAGTQDFLKCGNFTGCPFPQHKTIRICNWAPNGTELPPMLPDGRYMIDYQLLFGSTEAAAFRSYGEVYRPIYWEK